MSDGAAVTVPTASTPNVTPVSPTVADARVAGAKATPQVEHAAIIDIENVTKVYKMGEMEVHALRGVSLRVDEGEYVAIVGASGSGKSTLMNVIGLLDRPSDGTYRIRGTEVSKLSKNRLADLRNREIGFIFQRFNLLARTPAHRQVELPLFYAGITGGEARKRAMESLGRVGLAERAGHRPDELSGGQQQRVAIARALVNRPHLLLADEPTGALDTKTGAEVLALFDELNQQGITLVVVTHDWDVAYRARRIITLSDGAIVEDRIVVPGQERPIAHRHANTASNTNNSDATTDSTPAAESASNGEIVDASGEAQPSEEMANAQE